MFLRALSAMPFYNARDALLPAAANDGDMLGILLDWVLVLLV